MKNVVDVRLKIPREIWALVKAEATRKAVKANDIVVEILKQYFQKEKNC